MIHICDEDKCTGCTACLNVCSRKAIRMQEDKEGFLHPDIDQELCIDCGLCTKVCPINGFASNSIKQTIIACSKSKSILLTSSSGGLFYECCQAWCGNKKNYKIYGAAYVDGVVKHIGISDICDLTKLQGSKYVQSELNEVFSAIKQDLINGTDVLFSGTPCQVAGLKNFLRRKYDNLFCIDILCHGVPSPLVFKNYQSFLKQKYHSRIVQLSFVKKVRGWINRYFYVKFESNKVYKRLAVTYDDIYMTLFFKHYIIRPSCSCCKFTNVKRVGDITLADAWGVDVLYKNFPYKDGASMVMASTDRGVSLIEMMKDKIHYINESVDNFIKYNPQLSVPVKFPQDRETIIQKVVSETHSFDFFENSKLLRPSFIRILSQIKWFLKYR